MPAPSHAPPRVEAVALAAGVALRGRLMLCLLLDVLGSACSQHLRPSANELVVARRLQARKWGRAEPQAAALPLVDTRNRVAVASGVRIACLLYAGGDAPHLYDSSASSQCHALVGAAASSDSG